MLGNQPHKGVYRKCVMLCGHGEVLGRGLRIQIPALQELRLLNDLSGVAEKLRPLLRQRDSLIRAFKYRDMNLLLQLPNSVGEAGL
ncbi:hypothetical protein D3C76_1736260 [compost metagenome]